MTLDKLDDWLCDNWRSAWRWLSVQFMVMTGLLLQVLQFAPVLPADIQKAIPQPWGGLVAALWTVAGLIARLKGQRKADSGKG